MEVAKLAWWSGGWGVACIQVSPRYSLSNKKHFGINSTAGTQKDEELGAGSRKGTPPRASEKQKATSLLTRQRHTGRASL